ncbi:unnamed protein product, partial [Brassica napus]
SAKTQFWLDHTHSFGYHQTPARKVSRNIQLNGLLFANPEAVFVRKQCCNNP